MTTIRFEGVSKSFRQRHAQRPDSVLWAVQDVSFECREGEVLGLMGRNGSGKSTCLKLAANVTFPTSGRVERIWPVAPMLELGAGFHPELTGRENIQLNGTLLGLGRRISSKTFNGIVAFAEVEQHIDTPVKHYSSGMYARLGFSVAVHSPARLLLIDEVLAVGDARFREKCLQRMNELRNSGKTIVLVSHDPGTIRSFCTRAIVLDAGRVIADSKPDEALQVYDWHLRGMPVEAYSRARITGVELLDYDPGAEPTLAGTSVRVQVTYDVQKVWTAWVMVLRIRRDDGVYCASCSYANEDKHPAGGAIADIEDLNLVPGRYVVEVSIEDAVNRAPLAVLASRSFLICCAGSNLNSHFLYDGVMNIRSRWRAG